MGFKTRLMRGIEKLRVSLGPTQYITRPPANSINLNQLRMAYGGYSQPVWGPELTTVGAYSREGYTSKTFDVPFVPFSTQEIALQVDEDVQLAINHLSAQITGGEHYWKAKDDELVDYMSRFTRALSFDAMDNIMVKELLWYGNSVWKPRLGIKYIRSHEDLMHIPISSFVRTWWDRQRIPYKYEFRGPEYQGYHNPEDIMHFKWNPINASSYGTGFGIAMTTTKTFQQITPSGPQAAVLPSLLDRKYSQQLTMHVTERRYIPHNVYVAVDSSADERAAMQAALVDLKPGEDFVAGSKTEVIELGSAQRAFDPTLFNDLVQGPIMKAMNDFRAKEAGETQHTYANAKTSAILDEIGLSAFPLAFIHQLEDMLFKPWYDANAIYSSEYAGGLVSIPWEECKFEIQFGRQQKKDLPPEIMVSLIDSAVRNGAVKDLIELRAIYEDAGLPLRKEVTDEMDQMYNMGGQAQGQPSYQQKDADGNMSGLMTGATGMGGGKQGYYFGTNGDRSSRPMDNDRYDEGYSQRFPKKGWPYDAQPSKPMLNFDEASKLDLAIKREKLRLIKEANKQWDK